MSRQLPTECDHCGKVIDWGDFGPPEGYDGPTPACCTCECICRWERMGPPTRPTRVGFPHEDCPFHGRTAAPEDWAT